MMSCLFEKNGKDITNDYSGFRLQFWNALRLCQTLVSHCDPIRTFQEFTKRTGFFLRKPALKFVSTCAMCHNMLDQISKRPIISFKTASFCRILKRFNLLLYIASYFTKKRVDPKIPLRFRKSWPYLFLMNLGCAYPPRLSKHFPYQFLWYLMPQFSSLEWFHLNNNAFRILTF